MTSTNHPHRGQKSSSSSSNPGAAGGRRSDGILAFMTTPITSSSSNDNKMDSKPSSLLQSALGRTAPSASSSSFTAKKSSLSSLLAEANKASSTTIRSTLPSTSSVPSKKLRVAFANNTRTISGTRGSSKSSSEAGVGGGGLKRPRPFEDDAASDRRQPVLGGAASGVEGYANGGSSSSAGSSTKDKHTAILLQMMLDEEQQDKKRKQKDAAPRLLLSSQHKSTGAAAKSRPSSSMVGQAAVTHPRPPLLPSTKPPSIDIAEKPEIAEEEDVIIETVAAAAAAPSLSLPSTSPMMMKEADPEDVVKVSGDDGYAPVPTSTMAAPSIDPVQEVDSSTYMEQDEVAIAGDLPSSTDESATAVEGIEGGGAAAAAAPTVGGEGQRQQQHVLARPITTESWREEDDDDDGEEGGSEEKKKKAGAGILNFFKPLSAGPPSRCPPLPPTSRPRRYGRNRFWKHFMQHYQTDTRRGDTKAAIAQLLTSRMEAMPVTFATSEQHLQQTAGIDPSNVMEFDLMGALLAVGTATGAIYIYDFDELLTANLATTVTTTPLPSALPMQVMEPNKSVASVRWNPMDDTELAVAFKHWAEVYLYNLETWSTSPSKIYRVGHKVKGSAGGNLSLSFVPKRGEKGSMVTANLIAGSVYGMLRCWTQNKPQSVNWEAKSRGSGAIMTLCVCADLLIAACPDSVQVWDVTNLQIPILGATPSPILLHTLEIGGPVRCLESPSPSTGRFMAVTDAGNLITVDALTGRTLAKVHLGTNYIHVSLTKLNGMEVAVTQEVSNADSVNRAAALGEVVAPVHRVNIWSLNAGSIGVAFESLPAVCFRESKDSYQASSMMKVEGGEGSNGGVALLADSFDLTLPGTITQAKKDDVHFISSCSDLHRFLRPFKSTSIASAPLYRVPPPPPCPSSAPTSTSSARPSETTATTTTTIAASGVGPKPSSSSDAAGSISTSSTAAIAALQGGLSRRTAYISIEGKVYSIKDLWPREAEEGGGTEIELIEPFHRDIQTVVLPSCSSSSSSSSPSSPSSSILPESNQAGGKKVTAGASSASSSSSPFPLPQKGGPITIQASLRPLPSSSQGAKASGWARTMATLKMRSPIACLTVNPSTQHIVLGLANGGYEVWAAERYRNNQKGVMEERKREEEERERERRKKWEKEQEMEKQMREEEEKERVVMEVVVDVEGVEKKEVGGGEGEGEKGVEEKGEGNQKQEEKEMGTE